MRVASVVGYELPAPHCLAPIECQQRCGDYEPMLASSGARAPRCMGGAAVGVCGAEA